MHREGWLSGRKLTAAGPIPYAAPNAGGFTLEAELGITPNGIAAPDFLGWEVKQHDVGRLDRIEGEGLVDEAADEAFAKLKELYFDWNEIRVTTVTELAEGMAGIPDHMAAAQRVKRALQSIFEGGYTFDIEEIGRAHV